MTIKGKIKEFIENLTGTHIYRVLPHGIDLFQDISNQLPKLHVNTVFDVGANVGQSAKAYMSGFPNSHIYCFEPVKDTFNQLKDNLKNNDHIHFFQLAFGAFKEKGEMVLQGSSDVFFLLSLSSKEVLVNGDKNIEEVRIETLDEFCCARGINHISYLKIDTEGGDLDVLKGAGNMLRENAIDIVEVEAGMNVNNKRHVPFEYLKKYLEPKGYFLFGIYEQVKEWPTKEPHLRRINPVFISERIIEENKQ